MSAEPRPEGAPPELPTSLAEAGGPEPSVPSSSTTPPKTPPGKPGDQPGTRPAIRVLPDHVVDQIAAGEVVERPASVVKELAENALDAGATHVTVEVAEGGKQLIRVLDNGCGMTADEAALALTRHATSKLRTLDDVFSLMTMGFRGEALPSIAAVSRMSITTRVREAVAGTRLDIEAGEIVGMSEVGAPVGTQIEVRDLLYNVPARLKFLKGNATESSHVTEMVMRLAMAHPHVHLRLRHGSRTALEAPMHRTRLDRVRALMGTRLGRTLHQITGREAGVVVDAYLGAPDLAQTTTRGVQLYVGRRPVKDRGLLHAITMGYGELVAKGRYPVAILFVDVADGNVDVNVHPQKLEVRFADADAVYAAVRHVIRRGIAQAPWLGQGPDEGVSPVRMHALAASRPPAPGSGQGRSASNLAVGHAAETTRMLLFDTMRPAPGPGAAEPRPAASSRKDVPAQAEAHAQAPAQAGAMTGATEDAPPGVGEFREVTFPMAGSGRGPASRGRGQASRAAEKPASPWPYGAGRTGKAESAQKAGSALPGMLPGVAPDLPDNLPPEPGDVPHAAESQALAEQEHTPPARTGRAPGPEPWQPDRPGPEPAAACDRASAPASSTRPRSSAQTFFSELRYLGQLDRTYLVCEADGELVLVDQHAAHERVAFQRLRERVKERAIPVQRMLFPLTVELSPRQMAVALEGKDDLGGVGFELEPFGGASVAVKTVPAGLRQADASQVLLDLLNELGERGGSRALEERLDLALATIACHSVVRAGDTLSAEEVRALFESMDGVDFKAHCPHGRPVLLRISVAEIARRFGRT